MQRIAKMRILGFHHHCKAKGYILKELIFSFSFDYQNLKDKDLQQNAAWEKFVVGSF